MTVFATRLKMAMEEQNIRQHTLSEKTGISKSFISSYLAGRFSPKPDKLTAIAKVLEVSEGWLMGYETVKKSYSSENIAKVSVKNYYGETTGYELVTCDNASDAERFTFYRCEDIDNSPNIMPDDLILVEECTDFCKGDYLYAVKYGGKLYFRHVELSNDRIVLYGENSAPMVILGDYSKDVTVEGKALQIRRKL